MFVKRAMLYASGYGKNNDVRKWLLLGKEQCCAQVVMVVKIAHCTQVGLVNES